MYLFVGFEKETEGDLHTRRTRKKKKETGRKKETDKKERVVTFFDEAKRKKKAEVCPCMNGINHRAAMHYIYKSAFGTKGSVSSGDWSCADRAAVCNVC